MTQIRFLNRDRTNWLWAFSFVVLLLPLTLGQSSAGGCGATVTVPNPGPVDSDGDGFSDDLEITGTPGTDPNDPTDNPNNVRDSDGDGCSDYDEDNFPNFCDNDPFTPTSSCQTTYYNPDFGFGFDLPADAVLVDTYSNEGAIIFKGSWFSLFEGRVMSVLVFVGEEPPQSLADFVNGNNQVAEFLGHAIVEVLPFTLADGALAYVTSLIVPTDVQDTFQYRVDTFANGYAYMLYTGSLGSVPTAGENLYMVGIWDSLCID